MNGRVKRGFSLIEALIILLITAIALAVIVPLVTIKRQAGDAEKWAYTNNFNIFFAGGRSSANVGIGTSNPRAKLHVVSAKRLDNAPDTPDGIQELKGPDMLLESVQRATTLSFSTRQIAGITGNSSGAQATSLYFTPDTNNIGFGRHALLRNYERTINDNNYKNTQDNIGFGAGALRDLVEGSGNVALGHFALVCHGTSQNNTGINRNTAIGSATMNECNNNTEDNVVLSGRYGGSSAACGKRNVYLGRISAGSSQNDNLFINASTTGMNCSLATGSGNVYIGKDVGTPSAADVGVPASGGAYLNIGGKILGRFSPNKGNFNEEQLVFDTTSFSVNDGTGMLFFRISHTPSDSRLKEDIKPYEKGIDDLSKIKTYNFFYKSDIDKKRMKAGIIAQDLKKVMPEAVMLDDNKKYSVDYTYLNMAMVNAAKDLKKENDELSAELDELEKQINDPSFKLCKCKKQNFFDKFLSFIRLK